LWLRPHAHNLWAHHWWLLGTWHLLKLQFNIPITTKSYHYIFCITTPYLEMKRFWIWIDFDFGILPMVNICRVLGVYKKVWVIISPFLWNCGCRRERKKRAQEFLRLSLSISKRVKYVFFAYLLLLFCFVLFESTHFWCMKSSSSSLGPKSNSSLISSVVKLLLVLRVVWWGA